MTYRTHFKKLPIKQEAAGEAVFMQRYSHRKSSRYLCLMHLTICEHSILELPHRIFAAYNAYNNSQGRNVLPVVLTRSTALKSTYNTTLANGIDLGGKKGPA